jgi:CDP-diacylglycerol--serine O-phosphatidyltransferase
VPAPAGAICVLLPIYLAFLGVPLFPAIATAIYTLAIAFLMVSRLPVFSGKTVGRRVPPEMVLPAFVCVVLFIALLISYPWYVLTMGTVLYLISLPAGALAYRRQQQRYLDARAAAAPAPQPAAPPFQPPAEPQADERPPHLH